MKAILFGLTSWLLSNFAKKVLVGAGVTIVSGAVINIILTTYINKAISATNQIDSTYLGLLSMISMIGMMTYYPGKKLIKLLYKYKKKV